MHNAFAHQLLKLRTEQQLSQTDIANLLFVSRQAVSKWENGDTEPNLDNLIALARILNVSLENLITGSSNPNSLLLTLSHVSKSFSKPVLKDVNLTVHSHERIALLGANGAGKTTLIQIITGLINPDKGTVKFDLDPKKSLNIMPQENVLIPDITVLEQIKLVSLINFVLIYSSYTQSPTYAHVSGDNKFTSSGDFFISNNSSISSPFNFQFSIFY